MTYDKTKDLAGPGVSTYEEVAKILPDDYKPVLSPKDRMKALYKVKNFIEENLCKELNLFMVQVPLIVSKDSGVNDYLDRDGSRTPIDFPCGLGLEKRIEAQVVQAATKWKRMALAQFNCDVGEGICTDMRAVRKDYFLDHDHSCYVDQWDWEKRITAKDRSLDTLKDVVTRIWSVLYEAGQMAAKDHPALADKKFDPIPKELKFFHAEEILEMYPTLPRKQRETKMITEVAPAIFIIGIGSTLKDGYPHEMRAADYDDWCTPTIKKNGEQYHGLNGDILVWNPIT
jgi:aspartate--ammonia ligase